MGGKDDDAKRVTRFELGGEELVVLSFPLTVGVDALSDAEREVAALVLAGATNEEIARRRSTSPRTVANQVAAIFRKLDVSSRAELVAFLSCDDAQGA